MVLSTRQTVCNLRKQGQNYSFNWIRCVICQNQVIGSKSAVPIATYYLRKYSEDQWIGITPSVTNITLGLPPKVKTQYLYCPPMTKGSMGQCYTIYNIVPYFLLSWVGSVDTAFLLWGQRCRINQVLTRINSHHQQRIKPQTKGAVKTGGLVNYMEEEDTAAA